MPEWHNIYRIVEKNEGWLIPPLFPGLKVEIHAIKRRSRSEIDGGLQLWVEIIEIKDNMVFGLCTYKIDKFRKNTKVWFPVSSILSVDGGLAYAREHQYVKISDGSYFRAEPVTYLNLIQDDPPMSFGYHIWSASDLEKGFLDVAWTNISIKQALEIEPLLEKCFEDQLSTYQRFDDLYLPLDTIERGDDDEWSYHE